MRRGLVACRSGAAASPGSAVPRRPASRARTAPLRPASRASARPARASPPSIGLAIASTPEAAERLGRHAHTSRGSVQVADHPSGRRSPSPPGLGPCTPRRSDQPGHLGRGGGTGSRRTLCTAPARPAAPAGGRAIRHRAPCTGDAMPKQTISTDSESCAIAAPAPSAAAKRRQRGRGKGPSPPVAPRAAGRAARPPFDDPSPAVSAARQQRREQQPALAVRSPQRSRVPAPGGRGDSGSIVLVARKAA